MGFHTCPFCDGTRGRYLNTSSGDTTITDAEGTRWQFPDMLPHYIADHGYLPPAEFLHAIKDAPTGERRQTRSVRVQTQDPIRVGYLRTGASFPMGRVAAADLDRICRAIVGDRPDIAAWLDRRPSTRR